MCHGLSSGRAPARKPEPWLSVQADIKARSPLLGDKVCIQGDLAVGSDLDTGQVLREPMPGQGNRPLSLLEMEELPAYQGIGADGRNSSNTQGCKGPASRGASETKRQSRKSQKMTPLYESLASWKGPFVWRSTVHLKTKGTSVIT